MGIRKPDAAIYQTVEKRLGVSPEQCLLIDDSKTNVDGAKALGWDAILFTDSEDCRLQLQERGILPAGPDSVG